MTDDRVQLEVKASPAIPTILQVNVELADGTVHLVEGLLSEGVKIPPDTRKIVSYGLAHLTAAEMFKGGHST